MVPQNITIAVFVFGAVLILIALLSGGFKIFGVEVSGTTGKLGRIVAGAAGTLFLIVGLHGSFEKRSAPPPPPTEENSPTGKPEPPPVDDRIPNASVVELGVKLSSKQPQIKA